MKRILSAFLPMVILASASVQAQPVQAQIEVVLVPGGSFLREGSSVTVDSFYIGRYEITQAQYQHVTGKNPSRFTQDPQLPVEQVSWYDAVAFCNALSAQESLESVYTINGTDVAINYSRNGWRLPTEAEWEFAARGGSASKGYTYAGSNDVSSVAWFADNSISKTYEGGLKAPNEFGLYDMSGNVFEWCNDWYGEYETGPQINPTGSGSGFLKVLRGGSWYYHSGTCAVVNRAFNRPDYTRGGVGLRVVRSGK
jgi:formylglycine-generating enzyme required for sulfatase activity